MAATSARSACVAFATGVMTLAAGRREEEDIRGCLWIVNARTQGRMGFRFRSHMRPHREGAEADLPAGGGVALMKHERLT